jgi:hypothetical protein
MRALSQLQLRKVAAMIIRPGYWECLVCFSHNPDRNTACEVCGVNPTTAKFVLQAARNALRRMVDSAEEAKKAVGE